MNMNYASTNEPENYDSDYPDMTSDNVADMVCSKQEAGVNNGYKVYDKVVYITTGESAFIKHVNPSAKTAHIVFKNGAGQKDVSWSLLSPVASAPASVERLEDLAPELQRDLLALASGQQIVINMHELEQQSLAYHTSSGRRYNYPTERGAALVRDYQRRQEAQDELDMLTYEAVMHKPDPMRTVNRKEHNAQVTALKAENARLQGDLAAAQADMQALRDALVKIQYLAESFTDGNESGFSEIAEISRKTWQGIK